MDSVNQPKLIDLIHQAVSASRDVPVSWFPGPLSGIFVKGIRTKVKRAQL